MSEPVERSKFLWLTDTHVMPWNLFKLLNVIRDEKPKGVFLTGDITNSSQLLRLTLEFLGHRVGRPIYFCLGNHDLHGSSIMETHNVVRELCAKHKNLVWLDDQDVISLNDEVALIGGRGWYDMQYGNINFVKWTFDWFLTKEFRQLPDWNARFDMFRQLAKDSAAALAEKLEKALQTHKTVYCLTHFPPYREANRCNTLISERFYEPYNTNTILGKELERVMANYTNRNLRILAGHVHQSALIHVARNIECMVAEGSYLKLSEEQVIYI